MWNESGGEAGAAVASETGASSPPRGCGRTRDFLFVVEKALLAEKSSLLSAKKLPVKGLKIPC
jgi:hypothetical protein